MNFFKKALIAILSVGLVTVPATREVETVEAVDHTGGYVYFLKPSTWTSSKVMMFIGHNSYTSVYEMTKVSNTNNLYCYTMPSWGGATYVAFANASSLWGSGSWGPSNRTNATHYTNVYNNYGFNSGSYYIVVPASDSNNAGISINYKGTSANTINLTTRAEVYCDKVSNAAAGTVSVSGYYMSAYNTASTRSAVSSTSSVAYASTTLAPGSTATFTATVNDGYEFIGWSTSSDESNESNIVSSNTTYEYKYDISYSGKTIYALFKEKASEGPTEEELNEAKEEAIYALNNYKDYSGYNDEVKTSIQNIISAAESEINAATSLSDISTILANAKNDIDGIVELEDSKISAIESLNNIDYVKYSEENQNSIKAIVNEAITKINNATSVDEVTTALDEANTKISNIKTVEQELDELHKDDYLLLGSFNGWNTKDTTYAFTKVGARYEATVTLEKGATIKACKYSGSNWLGYHDSMSTVMKTLFDKGENDNLVVKNGGTYTFVLKDLNSPDYKDLFVENKESWSVIGLEGDWANDIPLTYNDETARYEAVIIVNKASEYKFRLDNSWDHSIGNNGHNGSDNNFSIQPGKYLFYVNDNNILLNTKPQEEVGVLPFEKHTVTFNVNGKEIVKSVYEGDKVIAPS